MRFDRSVGKYNANALPAPGVSTAGLMVGKQKPPQPDPNLTTTLQNGNRRGRTIRSSTMIKLKIRTKSLNRRSPIPDYRRMYCYGDPDSRPIKSWAIKPAHARDSAMELWPDSGGPTRPSPYLILPRA